MTEAVKDKNGGNSLALGFIAACLFIYICKIGEGVIMPFVVSVFFWYLINAIARFLGLFTSKSGYRLPRFMRFTLAIVIIFAVMFLLYKMVSSNINDVMVYAPKYSGSIDKAFARGAALLGLEHAPTLHDLFRQALGSDAGHDTDIGGLMTSFATMLTGMARKTLIVILYVGFLLYEQRWFDKKIHLMINDKSQELQIRSLLGAIDGKIQRYIGVKAFVAVVDSVLTFSILTYFGVDFAGFWGVMAFFLHFVPYAGSFIAIATPCLITLVQFGEPLLLFKVMLTLCTSHAFLGHFLDPYLMGTNLNLSPIFIISNLAMWGMIWGASGMFLAIPILAITTIALSQFETTRPVAVLFSKTGLKNGRRIGRRIPPP